MVGKAMKRYWVFFFWVVWVAAVSCTENTPPTPVAVEPLMTARVTATIVGTTISEPTITPEATGTAEPTETPVPSLTPTVTETPTSVPTLSPDEALAAVTTLYETNGGCLLPCWWGFTPNLSGWTDVKKELLKIAYEISDRYLARVLDWGLEGAKIRFWGNQRTHLTVQLIPHYLLIL